MTNREVKHLAIQPKSAGDAHDEEPAGLRSILVRMPLAIKEPLVEEVARAGSCLNDLAVGTLSQHFGLPFTPSGRPGKPDPAVDLLFLRVTHELKRLIQLEAIEHGGNMSSVITEILAEELGVEGEFPKRERSPFGGGRRRAA